jgi:acyl carrier protein
VCHGRICIEPSEPTGDAPCPICGTLLWFIRTAEGTRFRESREIEPIRERLIRSLCENLGVNPAGITDMTSFRDDWEADSLAVVELIMMLEEEFEITIPEDEAEKIRTIGEAIDCIERLRH